MPTQTKNLLSAALVLTSLAGSAFAQETLTPPPPPVPEAAAVTAPTNTSTSRYFGIETGSNLGLVQVDAQYEHFYAFASTTLGIPLVTSGNIAIGDLGLGYTFALTSPGESMWYFDMYGQAMGGRMNLGSIGSIGGINSSSAFAGFGAGVGLRYLHRSGLTIGLKVPVFGMSFGDNANVGGSFNGAASLGLYYLGYLASSAPFTIGFRF